MMDKLNKVIDSYLNKEEKEEFLSIVKPIINHEEFIKRMSNNFYHHSDIPLSIHIIEVACTTYKYIKSHKTKANLEIALKIAMLHDLYTIPWQNNKDSKVKRFYNKHGFRHPLEAIINSIYFYPFVFEDIEKSKIIIDGIIHHMYILPVRSFNINNNCEFKNKDILNKIDKKYIDIIIESSNRNKIFGLSICKSKYIEGRIVSKCDKIVSRKQIKNISSLFSLLTGKNKSIK